MCIEALSNIAYIADLQLKFSCLVYVCTLGAPGDARRDDVGHLEQLHADLLFVEELLLRQVEDLVPLARRGLADHLAQRELDVLREKC